MHTVIILAHPYEKSFNYGVLNAMKEALISNDESYDIIDLVGDKFDPVMRANDLAVYNKGEAFDPMVKLYQEKISNANKLILLFPIWWGGMPAVMKGFIDKVLLKNFSFKIEKGRVVGTLDFLSRTLIVTTSSRSNDLLINKWGDPIGTTLVKSTLEVVGIENYEWINFDNISKSKLEERKEFLDLIKDKVVG